MTAVATQRMGVTTGQLVGTYRITRTLGEGGMGVVYVGEHVLLGRPAAIKVLRPEHNHVREAVQRFFAEARATTAIRHPGIVEVYDFGYTASGEAFLVMELLDGVSLAGRLEAVQQLPTATATVLVRRIALALVAAHQHGVVHRDIKPDNIFLVRDGDGGPIDQIKLLDFGIARLFEGGRALRQTSTGTVMGTPLYMSPEQCRGASDCDQRSDLYSLGCVFFEMLTGQRPFGGDSTADLLLAHLCTPAPDVRALAPDVPAELATILGWLLAKDPAHRPDGAGVLVAALDDIIERHGYARRTAPVRPATPRSGPTTMAIGPRRGRWLAVVAGLVAAAVTVAAVAIARAPSGRDREASVVERAPHVPDAAVPAVTPIVPAVTPIVPAVTPIVPEPVDAVTPASTAPVVVTPRERRRPTGKARRDRDELAPGASGDEPTTDVGVDTTVIDVREPPRRP